MKVYRMFAYKTELASFVTCDLLSDTMVTKCTTVNYVCTFNDRNLTPSAI